MQSSTYKEIIESKIAEWHNSLAKLEGHAETASAENKINLLRKIELLKAEIDTAIVQLRDLDKQEDISNTMVIKNKILEIFDSIDRGLTEYNAKTPFML